MAKGKHSKEDLTTRSYSVELRAPEGDEERGVIEGVPIVFDRVALIHDWAGDFNEIIDRHALDKTDMRDVLLCVNHDLNKIALARSKNGKGTMLFEVQDDGLHMRATLDIDNNPEAAALYSAIQRGDISGMSFMFRVNDEEWTDIESEVPTRTVRSISIVHEVSVVNFPAYTETSIHARSDSKENERSPLAEARKAHAEEIAKKNGSALEVEKLKYSYLIGGR